jgi:hypothetical protein
MSLARNTPPASPSPGRHHPERPKLVASSHGHCRPRPQPAMATDQPQHSRANHGLPRPTSNHVGRIQPATLCTSTGRRRRLSTPTTATARAVCASCSRRCRTERRPPPRPRTDARSSRAATGSGRGSAGSGSTSLYRRVCGPRRTSPGRPDGRGRREEERSHAATIPTGRHHPHRPREMPAAHSGGGAAGSGGEGRRWLGFGSPASSRALRVFLPADPANVHLGFVRRHDVCMLLLPAGVLGIAAAARAAPEPTAGKKLGAAVLQDYASAGRSLECGQKNQKHSSQRTWLHLRRLAARLLRLGRMQLAARLGSVSSRVHILFGSARRFGADAPQQFYGSSLGAPAHIISYSRDQTKNTSIRAPPATQ